MSKNSKVLLVTGICLMCLSTVMSLFNYKALFGPFFEMPSDYELIEMKIDAQDIHTIHVDTDNERVIIKPTDDDYVTINYYESNLKTYKLTNKDGKISLEENNKRIIFNFNFNLWNDAEIVVEVPKYLILEYKIYTDNSKIEISDLNIGNSLFETSNASVIVSNINSDNKMDIKTSNGKVDISDSNINSIIVKTSNGGINIQDVKTTNINLRTSNGRISFDKLESPNIEMKTSNARVEGTIVGDEEDYYKDIKTSNSYIEIDGREYGKKILDKNNNNNEIVIKTSNGRVSIDFE